MDKIFQESLLHVCSLLNKNKVEYLTVGGTAVALYGYYRMSITVNGKPAEKPDLDFWYNPTYDNYYKLLQAIADMGVDVSRYKNEKNPNPKKSFFKLNFELLTVDFIPELPGLLKFNQSYLKKEVIILQGTEIIFVDFDDLIENKLAIAREKDLEDVEELKRIRNNNIL